MQCITVLYYQVTKLNETLSYKIIIAMHCKKIHKFLKSEFSVNYSENINKNNNAEMCLNRIYKTQLND